MYYDKQRKLAFVFPTKTGSHSLIYLLDSWGVVPVTGNPHSKPSEVLKYVDDIQTYTIYGFFRNPLDRFLSSVRFLKQRGAASTVLKVPQETALTYSYEYFVDNFEDINSKFNWYFNPQIGWFENANLLDFNKFDLEIFKIARMFDAKQIFIPKINVTEKTNEQPTQKVIDFVQSYYADDYRLGRERGLLT